MSEESSWELSDSDARRDLTSRNLVNGWTYFAVVVSVIILAAMAVLSLTEILEIPA